MVRITFYNYSSALGAAFYFDSWMQEVEMRWMWMEVGCCYGCLYTVIPLDSWCARARDWMGESIMDWILGCST